MVLRRILEVKQKNEKERAGAGNRMETFTAKSYPNPHLKIRKVAKTFPIGFRG